jgi:hypothetical protein
VAKRAQRGLQRVPLRKRRRLACQARLPVRRAGTALSESGLSARGCWAARALSYTRLFSVGCPARANTPAAPGASARLPPASASAHARRAFEQQPALVEALAALARARPLRALA